MEMEQTGGDLIYLENNLVRASTGKRFLNYLIDLVLFYVIVFLFGIILALTAPSFIDDLNSGNTGLNLLDRLFTLILYALYMSVVEAIFKGRSLGKLITGTKAVNLDGTPISAGTAFARGFSRAVPFCAFSALGTPCNPWQDSWTNTMVIDIKSSTLADN